MLTMNYPKSRAMSNTRTVTRNATMTTLSALQPTRATPSVQGQLAEHLKPVVQKSVVKWKKYHEQKMMNKLVSNRSTKKVERCKLREDAASMAQTIAVDVIAKEWLIEQPLTIEVRCYLLDKLLPVLVMGIEKLLQDVDKRKIAEKNEVDWDFNPINRLAQFLMRQNPKYCNFLEQSPYVRGLREVTGQLNTQLLQVQENNTVRLKVQIAKKRKEREKRDEQRKKEMERRTSVIHDHFSEWNVGEADQVPLDVIQKSLRTFGEIVESYPPELQAVAQYTGDMERFDDTGKTLSTETFVDYMQSYMEKMPSDVFNHFMDHLKTCASVHHENTAMEYRRVTLTNLFNSCDHTGIGMLDRHRMLNLFEMYWDMGTDDMKKEMRNPRRWPVVEMEESEDIAYTEVNDLDNGEYSDKPEVWFPDNFAEAQESKESVKISSLEKVEEESKIAEDASESKSDLNENRELQGNKSDDPHSKSSESLNMSEKLKQEGVESGDLEPAHNTDTDSQEVVGKESSEGVTGTNATDVSDTVDSSTSDNNAVSSEKPSEVHPSNCKDVASKINDEKQDSKILEKGSVSNKIDFDVKLENKKSAGTCVSFAVEPLQRDKTGVSLTSRTQSQMSSFDEHTVNVSQFVHVTETFLGENPSRELFVHLIDFVHDSYAETEQERMNRLIKARKEAIKIKHKNKLDALFDKWDNDGSGFLDLDEVETVLLKYKGGMESEALNRAKTELLGSDVYQDQRLSKREFRLLIETVVKEIPGAEAFDYFVDFIFVSIERSYVEKIRGEARRKWLCSIVRAAETGGSRMDPVYKALFMALYKDAESHGGGKKISANLSMLENCHGNERGDVLLRYIATTPEDADFLLGNALYQDMKGISFTAVKSGKPLHVPRVSNHGNIHFWNPKRKKDDRDGSFIVIPLKDRRKRVFGLLGLDTLNDPQKKSIFITHEVLFFQGVAKSFSIAFHHVDVRRKLLRISESAISWMQRRSTNIHEISIYMTEPNATDSDYLMRKMMVTDHKGNPQPFDNPPTLERKDNLFRDYLFKCVDTSDTVAADAYGERHLAIPLRDDHGRAMAVIDISIGELRRLPIHENREVQRMLKLLQQAHSEITKEFSGDEDRKLVLQAEHDDDARVDVMFDRLMLMELRENMIMLDNAAYAELRSYVYPPKVIHDILKAVLSVFHLDKATEGEFDDWNNVKNFIGVGLSADIASYDPTVQTNLIPAENVMLLLKDVPHGSVQKHASQPAEHLYNWVFVCLSLIEHTRKMRSNDSSANVQSGVPIVKDELKQTHSLPGVLNP